MTVEELKKFMIEINQPISSYLIDGEGAPHIIPGTIILEHTPRGICVYWEERDEVYDEKFFDDEHESVEYFLYLLSRGSRNYRKYLKEHKSSQQV